MLNSRLPKPPEDSPRPDRARSARLHQPLLACGVPGLESGRRRGLQERAFDGPDPEQKPRSTATTGTSCLQAGAGSGQDEYDRKSLRAAADRVRTDGRTSEVLEPSAILSSPSPTRPRGASGSAFAASGSRAAVNFRWVRSGSGPFLDLRPHPAGTSGRRRVDPAFDVIDDVVAARLKESAYETALQRPAGGRAIELLSRFKSRTPSSGEFRPPTNGCGRPGSSSRASGPANPDRSRRFISEVAGLALHTRGDSSLTRHQTRIGKLVDLPRSDRTPTICVSTGSTRVGFYNGSSVVRELCDPVRKAKTELLSQELSPQYWDLLSTSFPATAPPTARPRTGVGARFRGLQLKTLDLLLRREAIADSYREQFAEIMVDEFQDTNRLPMDLIDMLRGEGGDPVHGRRRDAEPSRIPLRRRRALPAAACRYFVPTSRRCRTSRGR